MFCFAFLEEALVPYSKPNFPSPGGHSSSGTASSKGSTGPRKGEVLRGGHQRNASDLLDVGYVGSNSQGQFTGELCKFISSYSSKSQIEKKRKILNLLWREEEVECDNQLKFYPDLFAFWRVLPVTTNQWNSVLWFGPGQICVSHANVTYTVLLSVCNASETLGKLRRNSRNFEFSWQSVVWLSWKGHWQFFSEEWMRRVQNFLGMVASLWCLLLNLQLLDEQYSALFDLRLGVLFFQLCSPVFQLYIPTLSSTSQARGIIFQTFFYYHSISVEW